MIDPKKLPPDPEFLHQKFYAELSNRNMDRTKRFANYVWKHVLRLPPPDPMQPESIRVHKPVIMDGRE